MRWSVLIIISIWICCTIVSILNNDCAGLCIAFLSTLIYGIGYILIYLSEMP